MKRERVRCSSLVDWPVYPRLAHTMRASKRTRNSDLSFLPPRSLFSSSRPWRLAPFSTSAKWGSAGPIPPDTKEQPHDQDPNHPGTRAPAQTPKPSAPPSSPTRRTAERTPAPRSPPKRPHRRPQTRPRPPPPLPPQRTRRSQLRPALPALPGASPSRRPTSLFLRKPCPACPAPTPRNTGRRRAESCPPRRTSPNRPIGRTGSGCRRSSTSPTQATPRRSGPSR
jgi:hypothetical protein